MEEKPNNVLWVYHRQKKYLLNIDYTDYLDIELNIVATKHEVMTKDYQNTIKA